MELKKLGKSFTVCKVETADKIDITKDFTFVSKTDEEISLVCETANTPDNTTERSDGWRAFRLEGKLDFSLIGILSKISTILAKNNIGIFAISTYNTDYILVKEKDLETAESVLKENNYRIVES